MTGVSTFIQPSRPPMTGPEYTAAIDASIKVMSRIGTAFAAHQVEPTANMTVVVDAGSIFDGSVLTEVAQQTTTTITAPVTNPRRDIVYVDQITGAVGVATGTPAGSPVDPAIPANKLPVARITLFVGMTEITNVDLTDIRTPSAVGAVPKSGGSMSGALNLAKSPDVASASTTDIWAGAGNFCHVTGTTTITSLGTAPQAGAHRIITFDGALTLTHNATSLILPGGANITTAAGDCAIVVAETTGNARVVHYMRANALMDWTAGTWTPRIGGSNVAGVQAYSTCVGYFEKIVKQVRAEFSLVMTAKDGATDGQLRVFDFPYNSATLSSSFPPAAFSWWNLDITTGWTILTARMVNGENALRIQEMGDNVAISNAIHINLQNTTTMAGNFSYRTA